MKNFFTFCLTLVAAAAFAQFSEPVQWTGTLKKTGDNKIAYFLTAQLDSGWHLYSQHLPDGGPVKTSIQLAANEEKINPLTGWAEAGSPETYFDSNFQINVTYFSKRVNFAAILPQLAAGATVKASVNYMVCNDEYCLPPTEKILTATIDDLSSLQKTSAAEEAALTPVKVKSAPAPVKTPTPGRSLLAIFFTAFLGGLAALLTPCVFPMVPLTVSYFTKRSASREQGLVQALSYSVSIILIYVALGLGVTLLFGIDALNALATNVWVNLLFFVLLVLFAISFLGGFDIRLPSALINKIDAQTNRGGFAGIFFMAFTLALVSFSCTGPIIGTLLFESAVSGNLKGPLIGMAGFSTALALPFGLFAAFPGWLKTIPKSGSWMNAVKVVLGFLELALALKFLSNADLVLQAGWLSRELFIALWAAIFSLLFLYLVGVVRFPHDDPEQKTISVGRGLLSVVTLAFVLYLIPGLWGAPLKQISGFPPPDFYKEWQQPSPANAAANGVAEIAKHASGCPNGLNCFHDYEEALAYARKENKPLLLDFTGWACVNCRKMEANVWTNAEVDKRLREDIVLVSLYVDDKRELPKEEQTTKWLGDKAFAVKTIGNKWSYFQAQRFQINSQPYYVLLDGDEKALGVFDGYDPSTSNYIQFLKEGTARYRAQTSFKK